MMNAVDLTKKLVSINSANPGVGEKGMESYICSFLADTGLELVLDQVEEGRNNVIATIDATKESKREEKLIFICHMDTVVAGDGWTKDPFKAEEAHGRIYGRGSCDMKSGLACALSVFKQIALAVKNGETKLTRPLRIICTVDEEGDMTGVAHVIERGYVKKNDWVLDLEPTGGKIQMSHKGRFWMKFEVQGITAHASRSEQGADAIAAAAQLIVKIREAFEMFPSDVNMGKSTVTFGQIQGGYQPYVVPDLCHIWMDARLVPPINDKKVLDVVDRIIIHMKTNMPGIQVKYSITGNRPYVEIHEKSHLLFYLKKSVEKVCRQKKEATMFPGYTDTAVIAGILGNENCMSYGPGDLKYAHKPNEFVDICDIERCESVLYELVKLVNEESPIK